MDKLSSYSSTVVQVATGRYVIRAAVTNPVAVIRGFKKEDKSYAVVAHAGNRHKVTEFEVRFNFLFQNIMNKLLENIRQTEETYWKPKTLKDITFDQHW